MAFARLVAKQFLRGFQCRFRHFQILVGEDDFPICLFDGREDGQDPVAKHMLFDHGVVLGDADEGLVDVDAGIAQQTVASGERETAGTGGIEQESAGHVLVDVCSGGTVVQIDVAAGQQVCRGIHGHGAVALIEDRNLVQTAAGSAEDRPVERIDGPIVLSVDAERRVEFRLFDNDVGQAALLRVAADTDVQIVFECPEGGFGKGNLFPPLAGGAFVTSSAPRAGPAVIASVLAGREQQNTREAGSEFEIS